jgi:hypothetical protein
MPDRIKECQQYIKKWYLGENVVTIRMDGGPVLANLIIQALTVELLRDFIDNPIPTSFIESGPEFNTWVDAALVKILDNQNYGLTVEQYNAVKNLAWNYWVDGISKTLTDPAVKDRLFKCCRGEMIEWANKRNPETIQ